MLSQDYPNFETIAVDDNSSDNTLKIMKDIKNKTKKKKNTGLLPDKLKIISLKSKPNGWTGKTWASEQGYLQSKGTILLFTDADTNYICRDVILQTVLFMQKEGLRWTNWCIFSRRTEQFLGKNYDTLIGFCYYFVWHWFR